MPRYFPAINYLNSYSGYVDAVAAWWQEKVGLDWRQLRDQALVILKEEERLQNIVKLIGEDALPDDQKATFYGARIIKEDFLQQSAYDPVDTYCAAPKQVLMLQLILKFIERMKEAVIHRIPVYRVMQLPVLEDLHRMKYLYQGDDAAPFEAMQNRLEEEFAVLMQKGI